MALDSIETPSGKVEEALGGSATYFSVAANLYHEVNLVGVVGEDFPQEHIDFLRSRGIGLAGLERASGRTFRWVGRYAYDLNMAETLQTQLNVFATFHPQLPPEYRNCDYVFLANIDPELQLEVLRQVRSPKLVALDSMNYWIRHKRDALTEALSAVDIVLMNQAEVRQYVGTLSLVRAAREILALGPQALVVKRGEYGASLFTPGDCFFSPAYPCEEVRDPTGAGDSFAGGFMGYLARAGELTEGAMRCAVVHGSIIASFTVEDFSLNRLKEITWEEIEGRYQDFRRFTRFEGKDV